MTLPLPTPVQHPHHNRTNILVIESIFEYRIHNPQSCTVTLSLPLVTAYRLTPGPHARTMGSNHNEGHTMAHAIHTTILAGGDSIIVQDAPDFTDVFCPEVGWTTARDGFCFDCGATDHHA